MSSQLLAPALQSPPQARSGMSTSSSSSSSNGSGSFSFGSPPVYPHTSIFDASDEPVSPPAVGDSAFPAYRRPSLPHAHSWAPQESTPKQHDGYFSTFCPPNPLTLEPFSVPAYGLPSLHHRSSSPSTRAFPSSSATNWPFPSSLLHQQSRSQPLRNSSLPLPSASPSPSRGLNGDMSALSLDGLSNSSWSGVGNARAGGLRGFSGPVAGFTGEEAASPEGSTGDVSSLGLGRGSPYNKDAALEILSRKIIQMEAKLNSQSSLMLQLRDENLHLKDRCARTCFHGPTAGGGFTASGSGGGGGGGGDGGGGVHGASFASEHDQLLALSARDCRTEPGTPGDTAVKCALGVLADGEFAHGPRNVAPPHPEVVARILSQSFSYSLVLPQDFRALTWTLAHRTQRSAQEGHALKFAANFLISKVQQLRGQPMETVVHDAILAEVVGLSQTANGNYLVQQLLDCGGPIIRREVYDRVRSQLLVLAGDKYGTHVVCKTAEYGELRHLLVQDLVDFGVAETFQTGARRLWKSIFDHCKKAGETAIFDLVLQHMRGRWAECATATENGTISVQQVFESWPSMAFMEPVFAEIIQNISRIANGGWGHFLISKLLSNPTGNLRPTILMALLKSPAPVAVGHHGISFLRTALLELGRPGIELYIDTLCNVRGEGQSPQIVEVAGAVVGPGHISFLWTMLSVADKNRLKDACRNHIVSIRSSQSGNDLLRQLGLMPSNTIPKLR